MNSTATLDQPAPVKTSTAPAASARTALDIWNEHKAGFISLPHALHDFKNQGDAAVKQGRLADFVPPAAGPALFDYICDAILLDNAQFRKDYPLANTPFNTIQNIQDATVLCLPESNRMQAYETVRKLILEHSQITPLEGNLERKEVFAYSAATMLLDAAEKIFPSGDKETILKSDFDMLMKLSIDRAESPLHRENEDALSQSGYAVALIARELNMAGYADEHLYVSKEPVSLRGESALAIALPLSFNSRNCGPVVVINGDVDYLYKHWKKADARFNRSTFGNQAQAFMRDVNTACDNRWELPALQQV